MKRLLGVIVAATLAYSGWWFYAAGNLRSDVEGWFQAQRDKGWQADYSDLIVRGFPNRTDLTLSEPLLMSPSGKAGWRAPFFQILSLSYKPGHVIVAWPDSQTVITPDADIAVTSDGLRASVVFDDQALLRSNLEAPVLNLNGPDHALALADVSAALQRIETTAASYRIALSAGSLAATSPQGSPGIGPESLASLRADLNLSFDQPLTFDALSDPVPQMTDIALNRSEISYGALTLKVTGTARLDNEGLATGEVTLTAENWRDAIAAARDNGDLPPALGEGLVDILSMLSTFGGSRDALDVTLGLDGGTILIGPIPVGKLPALRWP